jgi:2-polyprenyl-6-methoxyphenol hydroxylase-like FAD-dependent oxidoreductase
MAESISTTGNDADIVIIGAGIGGLTLALCLHEAGIGCRIFEAASEILPLGVGLNLLPHAMGQFHRLGIEPQLLEKGIETQEYQYFTRRGQLVQREPRGRPAGHERPQISIHRADLHTVLLDAVRSRLGPQAIKLGYRCVDVEQYGQSAVASFTDEAGRSLPQARGRAVIACDGVHSTARTKYHPEAQIRYEGTTQYRGTTRWAPFLTGASMIYLGTITTGKLVMYPIRDRIDAAGQQLINWVVEIERPVDHLRRDWNRKSEVGEFIAAFEHSHFAWLDVTAVLRAADSVLEYPMVDQDPLTSWTTGRVTLLGDAAHPMMPRGSNGSAQAILDATALTECLRREDDVEAALAAYESLRLKATADVVLANRSMAPDAILEVVEQRTGGAPFNDISDIIAPEELDDWQSRYQRIAGFARP